MPPASELPTIPELIEKVGLGGAQVRLVLTGGGVYFADYSELLIISSVARAVAEEWGLTPVEKGLLVTIVYIGMLIGNIAAGPIADKYGRRPLLLISYLGCFVFSLASSFMVDYGSVAFFRFVVGLSVGLGVPPLNVIASEGSPSKWRVPVNCALWVLSCMGECYSGILVMADDPEMHHLHWRRLVQFGAIPSLVFGIPAFIFMHESPVFLAQTGQTASAGQVIESMRRDNCLPIEQVAFRSPDVPYDPNRTFSSQWQMIWRGSLFVTSLVLMISCFTMCFVYYGALYAFPNILPQLAGAHAELGSSAGFQLVMGSVCLMGGVILGCWFGVCMKRKPAMKVLWLVIICSISLFLAGVRNRESTVLWRVGYYGMKCFAGTQFVVIYTYAAEAYPTIVRTTGCAVAFGSAKMAAVFAPIIYEQLESVTGSFEAFFFIQLGLAIVSLYLVDLLPYETFGRPLEDDLKDD